jgi:hypothetical protein
MPDESTNPRTEDATTVEVIATKTTGKHPKASDQTYIANVLDKNWTPADKVGQEEIKEYENERKEPTDCDPNSVYAY